MTTPRKPKFKSRMSAEKQGRVIETHAELSLILEAHLNELSEPDGRDWNPGIRSRNERRTQRTGILRNLSGCCIRLHQDRPSCPPCWWSGQGEIEVRPECHLLQLLSAGLDIGFDSFKGNKIDAMAT